MMSAIRLSLTAVPW